MNELEIQTATVDERPAYIQAERAKGRTLQSIADEMGLSRERIRQLYPHAPRALPSRTREILARLDPAKTAKENAELVGISVSAVREHGYRHGIRFLPAPKRTHQPKHGTVTEYNNHACRCDECRTAVREQSRQRRGIPPERWQGPRGRKAAQ